MKRKTSKEDEIKQKLAKLRLRHKTDSDAVDNVLKKKCGMAALLQHLYEGDASLEEKRLMRAKALSRPDLLVEIKKGVCGNGKIKRYAERIIKNGSTLRKSVNSDKLVSPEFSWSTEAVMPEVYHPSRTERARAKLTLSQKGKEAAKSFLKREARDLLSGLKRWWYEEGPEATKKEKEEKKRLTMKELSKMYLDPDSDMTEYEYIQKMRALKSLGGEYEYE